MNQPSVHAGPRVTTFVNERLKKSNASGNTGGPSGVATVLSSLITGITNDLKPKSSVSTPAPAPVVTVPTTSNTTMYIIIGVVVFGIACFVGYEVLKKK